MWHHSSLHSSHKAAACQVSKIGIWEEILRAVIYLMTGECDLALQSFQFPVFVVRIITQSIIQMELEGVSLCALTSWHWPISCQCCPLSLLFFSLLTFISFSITSSVTGHRVPTSLTQKKNSFFYFCLGKTIWLCPKYPEIFEYYSELGGFSTFLNHQD